MPLRATVARKNSPNVKATLRSFFLFIMRFDSPLWGEKSSAVIRSVIAPKASSRPISAKFNGGNCVVYSSSIEYFMTVVFVSIFLVSLWIVMGFPVAFARMHANALVNKQPTCACVLG